MALSFLDLFSGFGANQQQNGIGSLIGAQPSVGGPGPHWNSNPNWNPSNDIPIDLPPGVNINSSTQSAPAQNLGDPQKSGAIVDNMRSEANSLMNASGKPNAIPGAFTPMEKPSGDPRNLMNFTGLLDNPNVLTRLGAGYNMGGLLGALGYAMTDMNPNSTGNMKQAQLTDEARRYAQQNRLSL